MERLMVTVSQFSPLLAWARPEAKHLEEQRTACSESMRNMIRYVLRTGYAAEEPCRLSSSTEGRWCPAQGAEIPPQSRDTALHHSSTDPTIEKAAMFEHSTCSQACSEVLKKA